MNRVIGSPGFPVLINKSFFSNAGELVPIAGVSVPVTGVCITNEGVCVTNEQLFAPIQIKYNYCSVWNSDRAQVFGFADPCEVPEVALNTTFKTIRDYFVYDDEEFYCFDEEKVDMTFEDYVLQVALTDPYTFVLGN